MDRYRHSWMNTTKKTRQVCTRCGLEKQLTGNGSVYYKDNIKLDESPLCDYKDLDVQTHDLKMNDIDKKIADLKNKLQ